MSERLILVLIGVCFAAAAAASQEPRKPAPGRPWLGVHLMAPSHSGVPLLKRAIAEVFQPLGVNLIILEVNYSFDYRSHPELRASEGVMTRDDARELARFCRERGIRLVPQFQCLGHQSWDKVTAPLLVKYPELDETPDLPKDNPGIYCRSWCPQHPKVNPIVFALMDELIDAFEADGLHVGMDEVFILAHEQCPRCRGKSAADLFAKAVNDYHDHLVRGRKVEMFLWGDRLLDDASMKYGEWESSRNGTAAAIDRIPKDIVICDWHYEVRDSYPSVEYFQQKGFRVLPSSWRNAKAAEGFVRHARKVATPRMLGHLVTTWTSSEGLCRALLGEGPPAEGTAAEVSVTLRATLKLAQSGGDAAGTP